MHKKQLEGLLKADGFVVNKAGDVELKMDKKHTLIIHRSDEGIVLDVWADPEGDGPVFSTYFFDIELIPEEEEEEGCPNCDGVGRDSCPLCGGTNIPFPEENENGTE